MNVYSVLNSRAYTWRFAGANKSTNRFEALSLNPISNLILTQSLRATKITKNKYILWKKVDGVRNNVISGLKCQTRLKVIKPSDRYFECRV